MGNRIRGKSNSGLTLVEILISSGILILVLGMMYGIYFSGLDIWETARYRTDLQAEARIIMKDMISELRNATRTSTQNPSPNLSIPSKPNNKSIKFYLPEKNEDGTVKTSNGQIQWDKNNPIHYQYVPGQKELRRLEKGVQKILAQEVSDVQFIDIGIDSTLFMTELKMILVLNKTAPRHRNISITMSSIVTLRN
jgi:hypothetical protein